MLQALIFDVDGTLAETEELHRRAFNETFAEAGLPWVWSQAAYKELLKTTGGKERMARHATEIGIDPASLPIAELHRAKTARYVDLMARGEIALRPGIDALIREARVAGRKVGVATTTSFENVEALARAVWGKGAREVFDDVAAGDMVAAKKPAPDVYDLALRQLGVAAADAVALEDSRNGLRSAQAAGLRCVISPGPYTADEDFSGADLIVGCFTELDGLAGLDRKLARAT